MPVLTKPEIDQLSAIVRRLQMEQANRKASEALSDSYPNMAASFVRLSLAAVVGLETGFHSIALEQVKYLPRLAQQMIRETRVYGEKVAK